MSMKIQDLYHKYQIMPQLSTHMLRVAGVGKIVGENWRGECDSKFVTELCLLHDMGNIVKFELEKASEAKFGKIENLKHWQKVQRLYRAKYGQSAHTATSGILNEAELGRYVSYIQEEEKLYFAEAKEAELGKARVAAIILMYADCRVTPSGVVSYRKRIDDLRDRYGGVASATWYDWTFWFEEWMQTQVKIELDEIREESVAPLFDELLSYNIEI